MNLLRHLRRPAGMASQGRWKIACDCGWKGSVAVVSGLKVLSGPEIEEALDKAFLGHLGEGERSLYLLVDQRPSHVGNWIMPEGRPCQLLSHHKEDGVHFARYREPEAGAVGELPVGEVRMANGRVVKFEDA